MNSTDNYLIATMCMSLLWGTFVFLIGLILRFSLGELIAEYLDELPAVVDLNGTINKAGQNICPVEINPNSLLNMGNWALEFGTLIILTGIIIIVFSMLGFLADIYQNQALLSLVMIIILLAIGLEFYWLIITTNESAAFHEMAQDQMIVILQNEYSLRNKSNIFSKTMNAIMLIGQCCGIRGPSDFKNISFQDLDHSKEIVMFQVSPACCQRRLYGSIPGEKFAALKLCAILGTQEPNDIYFRGCYIELFKHTYNSYGSLLIVGLLVLALWETIGVIILNIGYTLLERMGNILNKITESAWDVVHVKSALSESMQNIAPTGKVPEDVHIGKWHHTVGFLLCFWAVMIMVISLFGFYSGFTQFTFFLIVTEIMLFIPWCIMMFVLSIFIYSDSTFHIDAKLEMLERLNKEYTVETDANSFVLFLNAIMLWYECCGITGYGDFMNLTFTENPQEGPSVTHILKVAPACCARRFFNSQSPSTDPFYNILNCAIKGHGMNTKSCYLAVLDDIKWSVVSIVVFLLIWNILVIVLTVLSIREIQTEEAELSHDRSIAMQKESKHSAARLAASKKFVPMAKESSFVGADVNRVKSTEIW